MKKGNEPAANMMMVMAKSYSLDPVRGNKKTPSEKRKPKRKASSEGMKERTNGKRRATDSERSGDGWNVRGLARRQKKLYKYKRKKSNGQKRTMTKENNTSDWVERLLWVVA